MNMLEEVKQQERGFDIRKTRANVVSNRRNSSRIHHLALKGRLWEKQQKEKKNETKTKT